jgi:hypothetical protein
MTYFSYIEHVGNSHQFNFSKYTTILKFLKGRFRLHLWPMWISKKNQHNACLVLKSWCKNKCNIVIIIFSFIIIENDHKWLNIAWCCMWILLTPKGQLIAIITYKLHLKLSMTLFEQSTTQKWSWIAIPSIDGKPSLWKTNLAIFTHSKLVGW